MRRDRASRAATWYRRFLVVLPAPVRREATDEMVTVFVEEHARRRQLGSGSTLAWWFLSLADLTVVALREHGLLASPELTIGQTARGRLRSTTMFTGILFDLRHAARSLRRSPGFVVAAVIILGLGIGANATIFTLVDELLLGRPPFVDEPERLVRINRTTDGQGFGALAYPDFEFYREQNETLSGLFAYDPDGLAITAETEGWRDGVRGWLVSGNYFDVLGTSPAVGRWFSRSESITRGGPRVAVVSHGLAQRAFGSPAQAVGSTVRLNGHTFQVIGVARSGFRGTSPLETPPDLWVPVVTQPLLAPLGGDYALERVPDNTWTWLYVVGRLRAGVEIAQAQADFDRMASHLEREFADWNEGWGAVVTPHYRMHPPNRSSLLSMTRILLGVAGLVLLVAAANVAILMLARASGRLRETGLRTALGAGRGRIARSIFLEALLVSLLGSLVGFAIAFAGGRLAASLLPFSFAVDFRPSTAVLAFASALGVLAALIASALPSLRAARVQVASVLRGEVVGRRSRAQPVLVTVQVALSVLLLAGSLLLIRSLRNARAVDLGFEAADVTLVSVNLRNHGYEGERIPRFLRSALERLRSAPGVDTASATLMVPFRGMWMSGQIPDDQPWDEEAVMWSGFNAVAPGYFDTMGIPLLAGRDFRDTDDTGSPRVAIVNQAMADRQWPGDSPIGKRFRSEPDDPPTEIVGLVADAKLYELDEEPTTQVYLPLLQLEDPQMTFVLRTSAGSANERMVRAEIAALDPDVAIATLTTMESVVGRELGRYRVGATLVGLFAVVALVLASVGLHGALSYSVAQQQREIGIRVALGAAPRRIVRRIVTGALAVVGAGAVLGSIAALGATRLLEGMLFGLAGSQLENLAVAGLVLLSVAALASVVPARRAVAVDPLETMREG